MELLDSHGVPAGPVYDIEEMVNDPHTKARNMVTNISSATGKNFSVMGHPVKYSSASTAITQSAPLIGQDSRENLTRFNFTSDEIDSLVSEGVISDKRINVEAAE